MVVEDSDIKPVDILLVEDNPADVELTQRILRDSDHPLRVTVAQDGEVAMAMLRKVSEHSDIPTPDLVLLDLNMPRMNGYEVLQEMSQNQDLNRIPDSDTDVDAGRERPAAVLQRQSKPLLHQAPAYHAVQRHLGVAQVGGVRFLVRPRRAGSPGERAGDAGEVLRKLPGSLTVTGRIAWRCCSAPNTTCWQTGSGGSWRPKLRVLLQMDEEAAKNIATSYSGAVQHLSSEQAMLHVAISQRLSQDFSEEDRDRLLAIDPRLFGARPQPARAPRQESAPPAPRRWWWPFGG